MSAPPVGPATAILDALQKYGKEIPVDFLARILGVMTADIERDLGDLEKRGVIALREGQVRLA